MDEKYSLACFSDIVRFNTHHRTPKTETATAVKILLAFGFGLLFALFGILAIVCSLYIESVLPPVFVLAPAIILSLLIMIMQKDMDKAYIEINSVDISAVDYYFGAKIEKHFLYSDC